MAEAEKSRRTIATISAALAAVLLWAAGSFHVVWGTTDRLHLERKVSWSLSEILINTDEITGTPSDFARAQRWPLYFEALKRQYR